MIRFAFDAVFCKKAASILSPTISLTSPKWLVSGLVRNLFRATQTEEKLRRENVRNNDHANRIHEAVGRTVRRTIQELGGTMPENLPVAEHIKKVESREKKRLKTEQKKITGAHSVAATR